MKDIHEAMSDLHNRRIYNNLTMIVLAVALLSVTGLIAGASTTETTEVAGPPPPSKPAYLTFDDGPDASHTPEILDILKRYKARATFFVVGYRAQTHPEIVLNSYYDGHQIGNHSFSHRYAELYSGSSPENYFKSLQQNEDLIAGIIGAKPTITRPPGGADGNFGAAFYQSLAAAKYRTILWTVNSGDTERGATTQTMINNIKEQMAKLPPGVPPVILIHDTHAETAVALPVIIDWLRLQGYRFEVVSPRQPAPIANTIF